MGHIRRGIVVTVDKSFIITEFTAAEHLNLVAATVTLKSDPVEK